MSFFPSFSTLTTFVWCPSMRTNELCSPANAFMQISNTHPDCAWFILNEQVFKYSAILLRSSSVTSSSACSFLSALPAIIPAAAAAATPLSPPVFGTITLLTFFNMFPLTLISTRSGNAPKASRAREEA